jgi:hypothetical protein
MAIQPGDPDAMQLYQIIGAPLLAVVQAEVQAAQVSADFIKRVGFRSQPGPEEPRQPERILPAAPEGVPPPAIAPSATVQDAAGEPKPEKASQDKALQDGGHIGDLRMVEFAIDRIDSKGISHPFVVKIPVLALYQIPLLHVKHAEFDYNIRILTRVPLQSSEQEDAQSGHAPSKDYLALDRVELKGMLARGSEKSERSSEMNMKVKIRMEQSDIPAGLSKLLSLMDHSVTAAPAAETGKEPDSGA